MSTIPFEKFLANFMDLKAKVNSNPRNLSWMARSDESLGLQAFEVHLEFQRITVALATSPQKYTIHAPAKFKGSFDEYRRHWDAVVSSVGHKWLEPRAVEILERIKISRKEDAGNDSPVEEPPDFSPVDDDAAEAVSEIFAVAWDVLDPFSGRDVDDALHKAFQAWDYFQKTIGVNLEEIYRRWKLAPHVFIPPQVSKSHGLNEAGGLYDLLDDANRAFVFGAHGAALAMCRALTETVLKAGYGVDGAKLKDIIVLAERRHPWMTDLKLQKKNRIANDVLHEGKQVGEQAVLKYLKTLKELIERAPKPAA